MNRWQTEFSGHHFQEKWIQVKKIIIDLEVVNKTNKAEIEELARLNKLVTYVDELLSACDPELGPITNWNAFEKQINQLKGHIQQFQGTNDIQYLQHANNNLDNMLPYIQPFVFSDKKSAQAMGAASKSFSETISKNIELLGKEADIAIDSLKNNNTEAQKILSELQQARSTIQDYEKRLFDDSAGHTSISKQIETLKNEMQKHHDEIISYYTRLTQSSDGNDSIFSQINSAKEKIIQTEELLLKKANSVEAEVKDLKSYHTKVFGITDDAGKHINGLEQKIDKSVVNLETTQKEHEEKYATLIEQIESLLPGATSAGLATAYSELKVAAEKKVTFHSRVFYASLITLASVAICFIQETEESGYIKLYDTPTL